MPVTTAPRPATVNERSTCSERRAGRSARGGTRAATRSSAATSSSDPGAGRAPSRRRSRRRRAAARAPRAARPGGIGDVGLRDRDDAGAHAEGAQHRGVLDASAASRRRRRRPPSGTGRCPSRPRPSCARTARGPGTSTTRQPPARGQRQRRVAERDRQMPRSRSSGSRSVSTPVSARTSAVLPWSMCPAVPSVSGRRRRRRVSSWDGAAKESNLPGAVERAANGFEGRSGHRPRAAPGWMRSRSSHADRARRPVDEPADRPAPASASAASGATATSSPPEVVASVTRRAPPRRDAGVDVGEPRGPLGVARGCRPRRRAVVAQQRLDAVDRRHGRRVDLGGEAALAGQVVQVPEQPEAGDVGHRVRRPPSSAAAARRRR